MSFEFVLARQFSSQWWARPSALLLDQRPDRTVYIKAPRDKRYGDILAVIDAIKGAGASPIGLQIDFLD